MNPDSPMEPDKYQQAWQAHSTQARVTVDADLLRKEVQRNQREFRAIICLRDFREVGVALLMIPLWFYLGAMWSLPWTWYLTVPALFWIIGFFAVDRMRHPQNPSEPDDSLVESAKVSLTQVEHQIWLLRNVFWWYLLPFTVSILAFFAHVTWLASQDWLEALLGGGFLFVFVLGSYSFIYYVNQRAVHTQLQPRRQELLTLLAGLNDETTGEDTSEESTKVNRAASVKTSATLGRTLLVMVLLAVLTALGSIAAHFLGRASAKKPRLATLFSCQMSPTKVQ